MEATEAQAVAAARGETEALAATGVMVLYVTVLAAQAVAVMAVTAVTAPRAAMAKMEAKEARAATAVALQFQSAILPARYNTNRVRG
jgi:hypothetical protein